MRTTDLNPLYRSIVGFDRLANLMDSATKAESQGYPPYNIQHIGEDEYLIELAVAGFGEADLDVQVQNNQLTITGRIARDEDNETRRFLHRGIAERAFERRFHLADHVKVSGAELKNGMLSVQLLREIPEEAKPRSIAIKNGEGQGSTLIEGKKTEAA